MTYKTSITCEFGHFFKFKMNMFVHPNKINIIKFRKKNK